MTKDKYQTSDKPITSLKEHKQGSIRWQRWPEFVNRNMVAVSLWPQRNRTLNHRKNHGTYSEVVLGRE